MTVLQVVTLSELGGAQSVVRDLANELQRRGHQLHVASRPGGALWGQLDPGIRRWPVPSLRREISPLSDLATLVALRALYARVRPDIVHLHSTKAAVLGRLSFPKQRIVYTVHGFDTLFKAHRQYLFVEKALRRRAARVVAVSAYDRGSLESVGFRDVSLVRNGSADPRGQAAASAGEAGSRLAALRRGGEFIVLCIARTAPPKRFDLFLQAAAMLEGRCVFAWAGNRAQPAATPSNLICLGELEGAASLLEFADVFILPSDYEGLPVSIIEACARGVPIVASDVGGVRELVDDTNGFRVPNDAAEFARSIERLRADADLRRRLAAGARARFESDFRLETMVQSYEDLYTSMLAPEAP